MKERKNVKVLCTKLEIADYVKFIEQAKILGLLGKSDYETLQNVLHSFITELLIPSPHVKK